MIDHLFDGDGGPENVDEWDSESESCPTCGGDGTVEYNDCEEAWGEDCPSEVNDLVTCPNCGGSGRIEDCRTL